MPPNAGRRRRRHTRFIPLNWAAALVALALAGILWFLFNGSNPAPMQSGHREYGLSQFQPVQRAASDFQSWLFYRTMLPSLITLANKEYTHSAVAANFAKLALDPARLKLNEESRVRVYFIGEGSGYTNALGINLSGVGTNEGDPRILFPNANTALQLDASAKMMASRMDRLLRRNQKQRTQENPLKPGDFVDLGKLPAGSQLNFFLIAFDGQGHNTYSVFKDMNPDKKDHMVATAVEGTSYLLVSFEDMFEGGDADYEDCVFAVEMSMDNVAALIGKLDPWRRIKQIIKWSVIFSVIIGGPTAAWLFRRHVRNKRLRKAYQAASTALQEARPRDAVALIRQIKDHADDHTYLELSRLELTALETTRDAAELSALYEDAAEAFTDRETACLLVSRTRMESDIPDAFEALRAPWRDHSDHPAEWLVLEADLLTRQNKARTAAALLQDKAYTGSSEALRLARLARLCSDAGMARDLITKAAAMAPKNPEVIRHAALYCESRQQWTEAQKAWSVAHQMDPGNLFILDGLAEFYRKRGHYEKALQLWQHALPPPTLDIIWLKYLFWSRVAHAVPDGLSALKTPPGHLHSLIEFMRKLPAEQSWNPVQFEKLAHEHVSLHERQEVYWLRLLHALHEGREAEALSLVTLSGFGERSWHPLLEKSVARILSYRRSGYLSLDTIDAQTCHCIDPEFFKMLDQVAGTQAGAPPDWFQRLLDSPNIFAAACAAAGWKEAAKRLARPDAWPQGVPDSFFG